MSSSDPPRGGNQPYRNNIRDERRRRFEQGNGSNPYSSRRPDVQPQQDSRYPPHRYSGSGRGSSGDYSRRPSSGYRGGRGGYYGPHQSRYNDSRDDHYERDHIPKAPQNDSQYRNNSETGSGYNRRPYSGNNSYRSSYDDQTSNRSGNDLIGGPVNHRSGDIISSNKEPREYRNSRDYREREHSGSFNRSRNSSDSRFYPRQPYGDESGSYSYGYQQKDRGSSDRGSTDKLNSYRIPPRTQSFNSNPVEHLKKEDNHRYKSVSPSSPHVSKEGTPNHESFPQVKVKSEERESTNSNGDLMREQDQGLEEHVEHAERAEPAEPFQEPDSEKPLKTEAETLTQMVDTVESESKPEKSINNSEPSWPSEELKTPTAVQQPQIDTASSLPENEDVSMKDADSEASLKDEIPEETVAPVPLEPHDIELDTEITEKSDQLHERAQLTETEPEPESTLVVTATVLPDTKVEEATETFISPPTKELEQTVKPSETHVKTEEVVAQVNGCIFPLNRVESKVWDLKHSNHAELTRNLKYLRKNDPIKDFSTYSFYNSNLLVFKQADGPKIFNRLSQLKRLLAHKNKMLLAEYLLRGKLWRENCKTREAQIQSFRPSMTETGDPSQKQSEAPTPGGDRGGRRSRHHGDSVRTEAEFLEILESLERESERDPIMRAQHGAAAIPDLLTNPVERYAIRFIDTDNLILNKNDFANRIETDPIDTFTEEEHEKFCEAYSMWPKKFGRVSQFMGGLRTPEECVLHYYKTKKTTNYKQLVASRNRRSTRKATANRRKASEKPKVANGIHVGTPELTDTAEPSGSNFDSPEPEIEYTDTGRRKRAAAPVFSGNNSALPGVPNEKLRRKEEIDENGKKKSRVPKRRSEEVETDSVHDGNDTDPNNPSNSKKPHISSYWSVHEINMFPKLVETYGTDWEQISKALGSKSAVMVRNYYLRNIGGVAWYETNDGQRAPVDKKLGDPQYMPAMPVKPFEQKPLLGQAPLDYLQGRNQLPPGPAPSSGLYAHPQFPMASYYSNARPPPPPPPSGSYGAALPPLPTSSGMVPLGKPPILPTFMTSDSSGGATSLLNYHEPQQSTSYDHQAPVMRPNFPPHPIAPLPSAPRPNIIPPKKTSIMSLLNDDDGSSDYNRNPGLAGLMNPQMAQEEKPQANNLDALVAAAERDASHNNNNNIN
ncbi:unnamed protein product [Kuraishia capsulata CBS 1993]|uniref:SANT domain-containing protein n=1 Tax=Kuraishia capsulata CBS 1993 TaxID=1382522 RepID=W6MUD7_9ASCO|nr:uncharacterized protein KUCA_T00005154001 [Kuraishia capsulata CBS 1993]CDK29167.1 unnamed protein product [Kuraishia capsulata CBS 1993]